MATTIELNDDKSNSRLQHHIKFYYGNSWLDSPNPNRPESKLIIVYFRTNSYKVTSRKQ